MKIPNKTMKTIRRVIQVNIVVLFFLTISIPAQAFSGDNLSRYCVSEGRENPFNRDSTLCIGLLHGYVSGFKFAYETTNTKKLFCEPEDMSAQQMMKIMNKYLRKHPEKLHFKYGPLFLEALIEAFPCNK
jgi:hypothetical protein